MGLTPLDIENTRFRGALAGYNRAEVDQFMRHAASSMEDKLEDIQRLKQQVESLEHAVQQNREVEDLLKNSVILAQKTCDELISSAHIKADLIIQEAQAEGQEIKQRFSELRSDREQFEYAFHGLLSGFKHRLEQGNPALSAPTDQPALPSQQSTRQPVQPTPAPASIQIPAVDTPVQQPPAKPFEGEMPVAEQAVVQPAETRLPFAGPPPLPQVKLTAAPGQGIDRDADMSDFESAVSDAKAELGLHWETVATPDEEAGVENRYQEPKNVELETEQNDQGDDSL